MISWSSRPAVHAGPGAAALRGLASWTPAELSPFEPFALPETDGAEVDAAPAVDPAEEARIAAAAAERARAEALAAEHARAVHEAYLRGYEEGRGAGEAGEAARLRGPVQAAEIALADLRAGESRWTGAIEENVCALAVAVARHLIGRELRGDPAAVGELVKSALAEFPVDQPVRIRVNPQDLQAIQSASGGDVGFPSEGREAAWHADPLVEPGGCVVEGRDRIIDGRVDTALERVYRRLTYTS
ncbi:FliH/SctL family protein [Longimicrobium sp.]|uniref:FliH/SctL family protein n=1 Tax=Longimicrobium sp. TaxID=2029185 RepID=UPI002E335D00|nr:FliH/SctL family protein [Longimicrobium sp.]HEX6039395.1 FliH/SctL family protein [Longimicrobium sp.]